VSRARLGLAGQLAKAFLDSPLTPLLVAASLGLGALALLATPREEEPQIRVPMIDVTVLLPGATPAEVERRVVEPLERELWSLPQVDHVYATARSGLALVTVRFQVGAPHETSLVRISERLSASAHLLPREALPPSIELHTIDDVPFVALTLWSPEGAAPAASAAGGLPAADRGTSAPASDAAAIGRSSDALRPLAAELAAELAEVPDISKARLIGGAARAIRIEPDPDRLAATGVTWPELEGALRSAAARLDAGTAVTANRELRIEAGPRFVDAEAIERVVVAARDGRPIYLRDLAVVHDGPGETTHAVFHVVGAAEASAELPAGARFPAVTIALAKRPGANAMTLAREIHAKVEALRPRLLPSDVQVTVTRDYGKTAAEKSNELVEHLLIATFSVVVLIALAMGWRSAVVVGIAVPVTLALTLFIFFLAGYTLNRVTLFALIFSIGILVDDAIVVVENIERHHRLMGGRRKRGLRETFAQVAVRAVDEVGNPTILATFTVIAAILPMAFVRGLMGPYMLPIPTGASAAMLFSLAVAFIVSPWAAYRIFRHHHHEQGDTPTWLAEGDRQADAVLAGKAPRSASVPAAGSAATREGEGAHEHAPDDWSTRLYRRSMTALLLRPLARWGFFAAVLALLLGAVWLVTSGLVRVKMLPFDNKSELQVLVDHDAGTPVEVTFETARQLAASLAGEPEVANVQIYAGTAAPHNFNGLVRHYFLRQEAHGADLQVNFVAKDERDAQSHDLAKRLRPRLVELAAARGARVKVVEIPPGPPVLSTLVAEIYGPTPEAREQVAREVRRLFEATAGVVDVDWTLDAERPRLVLDVDAERAALAGIPPALAMDTLAAAGSGRQVGALDAPAAREPVPVLLRLSPTDRADLDRRLALRLAPMGVGAASGGSGRAGGDAPGPVGRGVALGEITRVATAPEPQPILHKDLKPVIYVLADLAGERESPVYALADLNRQLDALRLPDGSAIERHATEAPLTSDRPALKWDGEWQITYEVFRDLGLAFAVVLALIAILVIGWFRSFTIPIAILLPIPLSLIGILPGHLLFGAFFTATSMIGFIAGAGIIVRNSIILVDFIELELERGQKLVDAVVEAGAVRFRPMLLTAAAVVVGSSVMLFDPIFQGLAISLMMGEVAATLLSRMAVPVVYYLIARRGRAEQLVHEATGGAGEATEELD
jgi:multidrug efflux pump subunit AcrB